MTEQMIEIEVWDGDEYYASAAGPADYVVREVKHYASLLHSQGSTEIRFEQVLRTPVTMEELTGDFS